MNIPVDLRYTSTHEWISYEGKTAVIGITDHAQSELGDIVFVELPAVDRDLKTGESFGTIEAVKTVADLYSPLSGKVLAVNKDLENDASIINKDPYGKGWIVKIECEALPSDLMDAEKYGETIGHS